MTDPTTSGATTPDALADVIQMYSGRAHYLLRDLADRLNLSIAYVDRAIVEAHLERALSEAEWTVLSGRFDALDFDEHVGDCGTVRTDWINHLLALADVPGHEATAASSS
jgi:hypothetical protein